MHAAVEFSQDEEPSAKGFPERRLGGNGVGINDPEEGYGAASGYCCQLIRAEEVHWIVRLAVGSCHFNAELTDLYRVNGGCLGWIISTYLALVADDNIKSDNGDYRGAKVLWYFDIEIILESG